MAVDFNTMGGNFAAIKAAMIAQGLTWGGTFRSPIQFTSSYHLPEQDPPQRW